MTRVPPSIQIQPPSVQSIHYDTSSFSPSGGDGTAWTWIPQQRIFAATAPFKGRDVGPMTRICRSTDISGAAPALIPIQPFSRRNSFSLMHTPSEKAWASYRSFCSLFRKVENLWRKYWHDDVVSMGVRKIDCLEAGGWIS